MKKYLTLPAVLLGFLVLISLFLNPRIYRDCTLLVGDSLYYIDPTLRAFGGDYFSTQPQNPLMDLDNSLQGYPFRTYVQASFSDGEIPWWNPYIGLGVPFVGLGSGVFDPVAALAGLFAPAKKLTNFIAVLGLWILASGMYLFLGSLGVSRAARVFGAVAVTFCGWTVVWLGRTNFLSEIWMPWIFWSAERLIQRPALPRLGALALFSALICLPAHPQTSLHIFAALSVYAVIRIFQERPTLRGRGRIGLGFALAISLGIGAAIIQIVPLTDLLRQSDIPPQGRQFGQVTADPLTAVRRALLGDWTLIKEHGPTAVTAIAPLYFGTPRRSDYWWAPINLTETTLYVGLLPLFFALYGFANMRRGRGLRVWLVLSLLPLGVAYGLPFFNSVNYLPGFDQINNLRLRLVYQFAIIVAAAIGFERFTAFGSRRLSRADLSFAGAYAAAVLIIPIALFMILTTSKLKIATSTLPPGADTPSILVRSSELEIAAILILAGIALAGWRLGRLRTAAFRAALVLIAFLDSFWAFHDFNPVLPSSFVFPETRVVKFLKKDPSLFRVSSMSIDNIMPPNTKLPHRLFDVDLYSVLAVRRYADVQERVSSRVFDAARLFHFTRPDSYPGLIDLLNVKYVIAPPWRDSRDMDRDPFRSLPQYRLVYNEDVLIYENLRVMPRAFLVYRDTLVGAPSDILASLVKPDFDPARSVLLEDPTSPRLSDSPERAGDGTADILSLTSNRVIVRARASARAYLVLSEIYYPGWRATVDGAAAPVYAADYLVRAVYLTPGTHTVVFTFMPKPYAAAAMISLACLGITMILLACGLIPGAGQSSEKQRHGSPTR